VIQPANRADAKEPDVAVHVERFAKADEQIVKVRRRAWFLYHIGGLVFIYAHRSADYFSEYSKRTREERLYSNQRELSISRSNPRYGQEIQQLQCLSRKLQHVGDQGMYAQGDIMSAGGKISEILVVPLTMRARFNSQKTQSILGTVMSTIFTTGLRLRIPTARTSGHTTCRVIDKTTALLLPDVGRLQATSETAHFSIILCTRSGKVRRFNHLSLLSEQTKKGVILSTALRNSGYHQVIELHPLTGPVVRFTFHNSG